MLSSEIKVLPKWAPLIAAIGAAAYAFPLIIPWHILLVVVCAVIGLIVIAAKTLRLVWGGLCVGILVAVLSGYLSSSLAAATLSASLLGTALPSLGVAILLMQLSSVASLQELVANAISAMGVEAGAPAIVAICVTWIARLSFGWHAGTSIILSFLVAWIGNHSGLAPELAMCLAALPACGFAGLVASRKAPAGRILPIIPVAIALLVAVASWAWAPPRTFSEIYVMLPVAPTAVEAGFFKNYLGALSFAGINAKSIEQPEEIIPGSLLLLPWMTSSFGVDSKETVARKIGRIAKERRLTVIIGGEHTDYGGVSKHVEAMVGHQVLRNDISVPRGNTDDSGPLHSADFRSWPNEAILNRGATVQVRLATDRVLLAGDGWWAEPDIGEWLWVGDYVRSPTDRSGRIALAVATDIDGARWIVVGDNSPFINSQIVADPRAIIRLIEMATLWPAFFRDCLIGALSIWLMTSAGYLRCWRPLVTASSVLCAVLVGALYSNRPSGKWTDTYVGENAFNERNFNTVLVSNPNLIDERRIIRKKHPVSGELFLPDGNAIIFLLVDGSARIGKVEVSSCRRMGSLSTAEGPYLMDAQACRLDGIARPLIGTSTEAAAFAIPNGNGETIIILDIAFLAQKAPDANVTWLQKELNR